ncbi:MAG: hypothetical protein HQM13_07100 [SAR324 cluster bacterium]|nr:hypothetical protein [SAR324 cluster bacterium]
MCADLFDPTGNSAEHETITYAPRPQKLKNLKVGLVDNTKFNSDTLLVKIAQRMEQQYGVKTVQMSRKKSAAHHVEESDVQEFKKKADFVIAGIGD